MKQEFSFSAAMMHFQNTEGPSGFLWKYFLAYIVAVGLVCGIFFYFLLSSFAPFMEMASSGDTMSESEIETAMLPIVLRMFGMMAISLPLIYAMMSAFEAAALRRYIRKTGFSIGLGADEFRIMAVYLIWTLAVILAYFVMAILMMIIAAAFTLIGGADMAPAAMLLIFPLSIAIMCVGVFFGIRLSPASALTIRDKKIRFFSAMRTSKNRFWAMFGAFLVIYIIVYVVQLVVMMVVMGSFVGVIASNPSFMEAEDPSEIMAMFTSPALLIPFLLAVIGYVGSTAFMHLGYLGITSKAALTDPDWSDLSTADAFS